jgi:hypothetical protein
VSLVTHLEGHVVIRNPNPDEVRTVRASDGTAVPCMEVGRIAFEMEFRFMLHRHWSLYESMYYRSAALTETTTIITAITATDACLTAALTVAVAATSSTTLSVVVLQLL